MQLGMNHHHHHPYQQYHLQTSMLLRHFFPRVQPARIVEYITNAPRCNYSGIIIKEIQVHPWSLSISRQPPDFPEK